jgi:hypothetical protein
MVSDALGIKTNLIDHTISVGKRIGGGLPRSLLK